MNIYSSTVILNFVITLSLSATTVQSQPPPPQEHILWRAFEDAVVNSTGILYNLSKIFSPPESWDDGACGGTSSTTTPVVALSVGVTVDKIDNIEFVPRLVDDTPGLCCGTNMGYCTNWVNCRDITITLQQPSANANIRAAQISNLLGGPDINSVLAAFDPAFYYLMKVLSEEGLGLMSMLEFQESVWINLHIQDTLKVMPSEGEMYDALSMVFTWAKAYARAHGRPIEWHDKDRYTVGDFVEEDTTMLIGPESTSILLMCAFILANLLIMIVALLCFDDVFLWLQSGDKLRSLYVASGIVLATVNLGTFICEIVLLNQFIAHPTISMYYVAVKLPLMVLAFTVEIVTISYNTYKHQPMKCLRWFAHSFACAHILWFVHRLVTDAIISITSFIIAPAQTLGILTLILSTVACMIIFVAYVVHKGCGGRCNRRSSLPLLSAVIIGITTCGLVFIFTLLFIAFVDNGLKSTGIGGFILSLIPPLIIFIAGLFVEWNYVPHFSYHIDKFSDNSKEKSAKDKQIRSNDRTHLCLSDVSIQIDEDENMSLKESVLNRPSVSTDENTPLLH